MDKQAKQYKDLTPLMKAARKGTSEEVSMILEKKVDINATDVYGQTALHHSMWNENKEERFRIVSLLIVEDADIDAQCNRGFTPLITAVYCGVPLIVKMLIKCKANLDLQNSDGQTAVLLAVSIDNCLKNIDCSQILLDAGANPFIWDNKGYGTSELVGSTTDLSKYGGVEEGSSEIFFNRELKAMIYHAKIKYQDKKLSKK